MSRFTRRQFLRQSGCLASVAACAPILALSCKTHPAASNGPLTGIDQPELAGFDELLVSIGQKYEVPGAALAVTKDSRLVYARGYGLADRDAGQRVEPKSLFRIASLSKPITAVGVLQLVERGKLGLEDKVHSVLELPEPSDKRWKDVTILQLMRHTGGWDRGVSFDPMFRSVEIAADQGVDPPAMPEQIIAYMLEQPLDFDPGARYAYSNFGYSLLGRVIERVTRMPYDRYIRQAVLGPLGVRRMKLGKTLPEGRAKDEVKYYDEKDREGPAVMGDIGASVPLPYGAWCLEAMDAHGGWIASAPDLVRFASAFDKPQRCSILSIAGITTMFARPCGAAGYEDDGSPKSHYYGCGWSVRPAGSSGANTWHTGALAGTSTLLVRRHDGLSWAVLFNTRKGTAGKNLSSVIDPLLHEAANAVVTWPDHDLFSTFF